MKSSAALKPNEVPPLPEPFMRWFAGRAAHMLGDGRLYRFAAKRCLRD